RAFSQPITTTKATAIYNMHTYWSKKPHDAIRQYIRHYTQSGDIVLDPFCGSGGTALAALLENRKAVAIRARAPQTAHILRDWLISSRVAAYDSPGTTWFTEESNGPPFPVAAAAARPFHPQVLHQVEGPASGPPAAPPVTRHPRGRPLCRHRRCPGLARDRDL